MLNLSTYHALIDVYGKGKRVSSVMELWDELADNRDSSSKPTINTLKIFIKSMISCNKPKLGMDFVEEARERFGKSWDSYKVLNEIEEEFKEQFEKDK